MHALIPEFAVTDLAASRAFYEALGFTKVYDRPEDGFVRLRLGAAEIMLDQIGLGRDPSDLTPADRPFGRGLNLQVEVSDLTPILSGLAALNRPPRLGPETRWYRAGTEEIGQRQLWVSDPDGYLLRFCVMLGRRAVDAATDEAATRSAEAS